VIRWLANKFGYVSKARIKIRPRNQFLGRFDAASQSPETRRHWARADSLAADAAADSQTRTTIRNRSRYERFNNPYMCGQIRTLANDVVGIGPALQMVTPNETVNAAVENKFGEWSEVIGLDRILRLARQLRASDGEVFIRLIRNRRLSSPVKLDLQMIEADQCRSPYPYVDDPNAPDGMEVDENGNPLFYWFSRTHPGAVASAGFALGDFIRVPAADVIHYFLLERPGQHRGLPEVVSSLNLHAERRNLRQSVLSAARVAAQLGAVILESQTEAEVDDLPPEFDTIDLEMGMMTQAPYGTRPHQMKPEQPATTYREFDERLINEQARPLNMPYNIAAADSKDYNYASGRLDHQTYDRMTTIDQHDLSLVILRPIIQAWALEATAVPGYLPRRAERVYLPNRKDPLFRVPCTWIWGDREHIDPLKEARAMEVRLDSRTTTLAAEIAKTRRDWRDVVTEAGSERKAIDEAGLYQINPQLVPGVLEALKLAGVLGEAATIEVLVVLGVPKQRARAIVEGMGDTAPSAASIPNDGDVGSLGKTNGRNRLAEMSHG
jgi:lambda family phage portal protein